MMINRCEIADIVKCNKVVTKLNEIGYDGKEFSQKEFDKVFKGTKVCTLDWLRKNGLKDGKVRNARWSKDTIPFVELSRVEYFEIPNKDKISDRVVCIATNKVVDDVSPYKFKYDSVVKDLVNKLYGDCEVRKVSAPIMGRKHFYKINVDALANITEGTDFIIRYYSDKLEKTKKLIEKYQAILDFYND